MSSKESTRTITDILISDAPITAKTRSETLLCYDITRLLHEVFEGKMQFTQEDMNAALSVYTIFDTSCIQDALPDLEHDLQQFVFHLLRKNHYILDFPACLLEFIIKYSVDLYIEQQKNYINDVIIIVNEILNKETTDFDFDVFEYIIDNYDNIYCIRGCVETLIRICTKYKKLPSNKTPNELSDMVFDIALHEERPSIINTMLDVVSHNYGEDQALVAIEVNTISSTLLSGNCVNIGYLEFAKRKLMLRADEHINFMHDIINHSNSYRLHEFLAQYPAKNQYIIAEILCITLGTAWKEVFSYNEMHVKNILLFTANANIKATTDVMLVIMHEHATGKNDLIDKDFITEVFEECYTNSDDDFDFDEYDSYTKLCELLNTYFPL